VRVLSFDASSGNLHICLSDKGQIVAARRINSKIEERQYAVAQLIPAIQLSLEEANWKKADIRLLVVGIGPGSFTQIRNAVASARAIAQGLSLPLIGISLLECYVFRRGLSAAVVLGAGRERFFAAYYEALPIAALNDSSLLDEATIKRIDLVPKIGPLRCNQKELFEMLAEVDLCLVDASLPAAHLGVIQHVEPLPVIENVAVTQSELAINRLSLMISAAKLNNHFDKEALSAVFPYERVQPLYLQNASVTLKST